MQRANPKKAFANFVAIKCFKFKQTLDWENNYVVFYVWSWREGNFQQIYRSDTI